MPRVRAFSIQRYVEQALQMAEYHKDENGVIIAKVPDVAGFFSQGDSFEEARENLREAIEGNVLLALQLGLEIPLIEGITLEETDVQVIPP